MSWFAWVGCYLFVGAIVSGVAMVLHEGDGFLDAKGHERNIMMITTLCIITVWPLFVALAVAFIIVLVFSSRRKGEKHDLRS